MQTLLVQLIQVVEAFGLSFSSDKQLRVRQLEDIAPWLVPSSQWREIENKRAESAEIARMAMENEVQDNLQEHATMLKERRAKRLAAKPKPAKRKPTPKRKPATKERTGGKKRKA